jgi:hypothetical protein
VPVGGEPDEVKKNDLKTSAANSLKLSHAQNEASVNDLVNLDDENPWLHPPETYGVAITGKAFDILVNDP